MDDHSSIKKIRLGTRSSRLALSQVAEIHLLIAEKFPEIKIEIVPITTSGDKIQDRNLSEIGGKGLFIKELEEALILDKIDVAVHSAKDVPPILHNDTELCAFTQRIDVRDCFVSSKHKSFSKLPKNAVIGTSSTRRKAFILKQRPDIKIVNFRGNIDTRLKKVNDLEVDGAILAASGLIRLGKENNVIEVFDIEKMLPSGGQGALALQINKNNQKLANIIAEINDKNTQICVKTERAFLRELGASCSTPVGVYAQIIEDKIILKTAIIDYDGSEIFETNSSTKISLKSGVEMAIKMAQDTKNKAPDLFKKICN